MSEHAKIYSRHASKYDELIAKQPNLSAVVGNLCPFDGLDVLDLGAGSGRLTSCLLPLARSVAATDGSSAMLELLLARTPEALRHRLSTAVADHRSLPYAEASFDLIVAGWSLCYIAETGQPEWRANLERAIAEMRRVLRPNGTIIIFETLGTGFEQPNPPCFLTPYFIALQEQYGFTHQWMRADYRFADVAEAMRLTEFFFGADLAATVQQRQWSTVPECAGIWWRTF